MINYKKKKKKRNIIARERMYHLFELSKKEGSKHNMRYATRYVEIARKLGMRHRIPVPKRYKHLFCRKCGAFLQPGFNSRVRIQNKKVIRRCEECGAVRRIPLKHAKASSKTSPNKSNGTLK